MAKESQTAMVKVFSPCACSHCKSGNRLWFYCQQAPYPIAIYMCDPIGPDDPLIPHKDCLRYIEAQHPGCTFVYID